MRLPLLLCLLYYFLCDVDGLKILVCFPLPVKSLSILGEGVVRNLLVAGHEVTYITVYPLKNPPKKNFRQIDISSNTAFVAGDHMPSIEFILNNKVEKTPSRDIQLFGQEAARMTLNHENVTKLLEDPNEHFDVILSDLLETELYSGFAVVYECPMIWVYSMGAHWQVLRMIDVAPSPAYDTDYLSSNTIPLSFAERVDELWTRIQWQFYKTFFTQPEERRIYEAVFGAALAKRGRALPDYEEVIYNASLIFANEHDAVRNRPSTPQNFKYIGGIHVEEPVKPLPKDLQDLIDNSKHGVIYFSMGSFLQSKTLPRKLITELLQMFGEFKQTVIWKFEDNSLVDVPKNVQIVNWAPQQSILAHPNVKMFLTHGGLFSSIEAIHFGVPTIGIPALFDQITNVNKAVLNGYALKVELSHDLAKDLKAAIGTMLSDDRYTKKVKELSALYHDRLTKPGPALVYWVEHVVRTRGAPHLRSPALHVPLYQRLYLDLLAIILTTTFAFVLLLRRLCKKSNATKYDQKKTN
ncbi:UDP-glucosyltransferase 2-like [Spodoptera frugiperda]|uniref:UDP-glucosyltransferase 2-like n=1 Tax=Spodoptera frugiperda TaxID=7108 RepID=A0A9R0EQR6_SPOFR|nr:UDP-glucosyltransferase 2-like [Spodoptera frugiperda]